MELLSASEYPCEASVLAEMICPELCFPASEFLTPTGASRTTTRQRMGAQTQDEVAVSPHPPLITGH